MHGTADNLLRVKPNIRSEGQDEDSKMNSSFADPEVDKMRIKPRDSEEKNPQMAMSAAVFG